MTNEVTEGKTAARELAARLPGWMVWYGEHTKRFWAVPRAATTAGAQLAEGDSVQELEEAVRRMSGGAPQQMAPAQEAPRPEQAPVNAPPMGAHPGPVHRQPVTANG
ncbi:hypothetical protein [Sphaerisporangium fuscum]|uniref:hypothetical protein n=1 Tax=Sphaerisporangium fuscum TaxID=2835868 RepID=UPI001BDC9A8D|nr:hypothetical protein [Sphaerisporangium fuscum]